ncbi:MAG: 3-keto-5-aminohexanoate cleavage protein [Rhodospirillales bacterium]|nr:3-keto-5-aminohexanoate cleavage protein [Rhodospirillales bacterium]
MPKQRKVIIACAVTGSIHTASMSLHPPIAPNQIAEAAIGAAGVDRRASGCDERQCTRIPSRPEPGAWPRAMPNRCETFARYCKDFH